MSQPHLQFGSFQFLDEEVRAESYAACQFKAADAVRAFLARDAVAVKVAGPDLVGIEYRASVRAAFQNSLPFVPSPSLAPSGSHWLL